MKKFIIIILICLSSLSLSLTPINPIIDVGKDIYLQHDEYNISVYDIVKSGKGKTTVYKEIIPKFKANYVWLTNGTQIKNIDPGTFIYSCTDKPDYIPVKEGEEYFVKLYGVGGVKVNETFYYYAPILFFDENDNLICDNLTGTFSKSKSGVTLEVPTKARKMHITMLNSQSLSIQKVINMTDAEIDKLLLKNKVSPILEQNYEKFLEDPVIYKKMPKTFISFVNDDTRGQINDIVDLFIEKGVPLCLATIPENLKENANGNEETRLEGIRRLIKSGKGEILAHNGPVLTNETLTNYSALFSNYIKTKQYFNSLGIETNGIILAGGSGQIVSHEVLEKWVSSFYSYSDLYGFPTTYKGIATDSVYYHPRTGLLNFKNVTEDIKKNIDAAIESPTFKVYYFHEYSEIDKQVLSEILDYVKLKQKEGKLEIGTYKQMYEKYATSVNKLISTKHTYYVSNSGTSLDGTSITDPMSYETMNKKGFITGDKILLRRGETFYGAFNVQLEIVDNTSLIVSTYGGTSKPKPIISGFKIINSKNSWVKEEDKIYKVDLTDTTKFKGVQAIDSTTNKIGFIEDNNGVKYYKLKSNVKNLTDDYDFCGDGTYFYIRTKGKNPYEELGTLKLATRTYLFLLKSQMIVKNLHIQGTGGHGMEGSQTDEDTIEIVHNIIEDIGGSYLKDGISDTTRYGNGIEFYGSNAKNIHIHKNIIRNVYDVGFTIQGNAGCGLDVLLEKNIFIQNSQDSEIWENDKAKGVKNYLFTDNISINQGRGWGYDARPDKYPAGHILFWGYYYPDSTKIQFYENYVYNPLRIYYIAEQSNTSILFRDFTVIDSDKNEYYCNNDTYIYRSDYKYSTKDQFISTFNKDHNSNFILMEKVDEKIVETAKTSLNYRQLRSFFVDEPEEKEEDEPVEPGSGGGIGAGWIVFIIFIIIIVGLGVAFFIKKKFFANRTLLIENKYFTF